MTVIPLMPLLCLCSYGLFRIPSSFCICMHDGNQRIVPIDLGDMFGTRIIFAVIYSSPGSHRVLQVHQPTTVRKRETTPVITRKHQRAPPAKLLGPPVVGGLLSERRCGNQYCQLTQHTTMRAIPSKTPSTINCVVSGTFPKCRPRYNAVPPTIPIRPPQHTTIPAMVGWLWILFCELLERCCYWQLCVYFTC